MENWLIVVPARLGSERLPRKPLQVLGGRPLIVQVVENLRPLEKKGISILVATDAREIKEVCESYKILCEITKTSHVSGTDRVFEVASRSTAQFILNVQGDEPFINTDDLLKLMSVVQSDKRIDIGTLVCKLTESEKFKDPSVVKAVADHENFALYFSRAMIPFNRNDPNHPAASFLKHIGVYAFRRQSLEKMCQLPQAAMEQAEKLEQLRALYYGMRIKLIEVERESIGIDTKEDLEAANAFFKKNLNS